MHLRGWPGGMCSQGCLGNFLGAFGVIECSMFNLNIHELKTCTTKIKDSLRCEVFNLQDHAHSLHLQKHATLHFHRDSPTWAR